MFCLDGCSFDQDGTNGVGGGGTGAATGGDTKHAESVMLLVSKVQISVIPLLAEIYKYIYIYSFSLMHKRSFARIFSRDSEEYI